LHGQRRLPEAERLYRATLKRDDRHFGARYQLGVLKLQQGRLAEAETWLRRALKVNQNSAETRHYLGIVFAELQRSDDAIAALRKGPLYQPGLRRNDTTI
jgi:Flp pilus assembly protein TadD